MAYVRLKGLNRARKRLKDGREVVYWYAWKGGPRLDGQPGSPEFIASYNRAVADRRAPRHENLAALVARYRASPEYLQKLAPATRKEWARWLDRIAADQAALDIGGLPIKALDDRRVRADLLEWRDQWADRPRSADYAMQVLSRVLAFGVDRGLLAINAIAGVAQLYASDRADQIWTAQDLAAFAKAAPSPEVAVIPQLACLTGLRRTGLTRLALSHVGDLAIVMPAAKKRKGKARDVVIPLLPETKALLVEIRARQLARHAELTAQAAKKRRPPPPEPTTVLTNTRGLPWTPDGLEAQVIKAKAAAGVDKHLHDARGTFATRLRMAGLSASEIADVLGWEEDRVQRLLETYVDRESVVRSIAGRLSAASDG